MWSSRRAALGATFVFGIILLAISILIPGMVGDGNPYTGNDTPETEEILASVSAGEKCTVEVGEGVRFAGRCLADAKAAGTLSYIWDFGDGTTEQGTTSPLHAYAHEGRYTVTFTVTDAWGNALNDTLEVTVESTAVAAETEQGPETTPSPPATGAATPAPSPQPTATATPAPSYSTSSSSSSGDDDDEDESLCDFSASVREGPAPLTVTFNDASPAVAEKWFWDFGDGGSSTEQNPTHEYASPGSYSVYLTVEDEDDDQYREIKNGYIVVTEPPIPPQTDFTADVTAGEAPLTVSFSDTSSGTPTSWSWAFGDGGTSTGQNPVHEYTAAGTYTVTLTAENGFGSATEVKEGYISVTAPPSALEADFTADVTSGYAPLNVHFEDLSSGDVVGYAWDFGDGRLGGRANPTHRYRDPGTYTVSLTVFGLHGMDTETKTGFITVLPDEPPVPEEPTPEPTEEPTMEPTEEPTPEPTEEPTMEPTEAPTPEPTEEPDDGDDDRTRDDRWR